MTPKITQKNYEAIKIYNQKEKIFELKGQIQTLKKQLAIAVEGLEHFSECEDWNDPDFYIDKKEIADLADDYLKQIRELEK